MFRELKKELRMLIAEKLLYWAICLSPKVIDLFIKNESTEIEQLVIEAKKNIKTIDI